MAKITSRGIKFPFTITNKNGEIIQASREMGTRGYIYSFKTENKGYFSYSTSSFADMLKYAHLTYDEVRYH